MSSTSPSGELEAAAVEASLLALVPPGSAIGDPGISASYANDQSHVGGDAPLVVLAPRTSAEVAVCMRAASELGLPVMPRGAGSGLVGGSTARGRFVTLSLHRMNRVLEIDVDNRLAVVQPGVITGDLRRAVAEHGLFYPPDPGSVDFCTIGGNVATNAGGMCCLRYGVTSDYVRSLEVVLASGEIIRTGTRTAKGVAGYDLTSLLVGSEGTLGVFTEVTVRLLQKPQPLATVVGSFLSLSDAGHFVKSCLNLAPTPTAIEILDRTTVDAIDAISGMSLGSPAAVVVVQVDDVTDAAESLSSLAQRAGAVDFAYSETSDEADQLMSARRLALPALERLGDYLLDDVAVPISELTTFLTRIEEIAQRERVTIGVFGHAGDGNLHPTIIYDKRDRSSVERATRAFDAITKTALGLGGTITGEHGVGRLKAAWLRQELSEPVRDISLSLKAVFDPQNLLSPGVVWHTGDFSAGSDGH